MEVHFYTYTDKQKNVAYKSEATFLDNTYKFKDITLNNSYVSFIIKSSDNVIVKRDGEVINDIEFILNKTTRSLYKSNGLSFYFEVFTKNISVKDDSISIDYDFFYDNEKVGSTKIVLLIKNVLKKSKL